MADSVKHSYIRQALADSCLIWQLSDLTAVRSDSCQSEKFICFFGLIFTILHRFVFQLKKTFFSVAIFIFIHSVQAQIQSKKRNSLQNNNLQSQRSKMKQMLISYFISSPLHQYPSFHHYLKHQTHLQICSEPVFWLCKIIRILESFFRNATC